MVTSVSLEKAPVIVIESIDSLRAMAGSEVAVSEWMPVEQTRIDRFAEASGDHQWIHVAPERAARESPYGGTIAHGFLTLSLLSQFLHSSIEFRGELGRAIKMSINYGLNRVRFPAAVRSGSKIRARFTLQSCEDIAGGIQNTWLAIVEQEGSPKPCMAAEWVVRSYFS